MVVHPPGDLTVTSIRAVEVLNLGRNTQLETGTPPALCIWHSAGGVFPCLSFEPVRLREEQRVRFSACVF